MTGGPAVKSTSRSGSRVRNRRRTRVSDLGHGNQQVALGTGHEFPRRGYVNSNGLLTPSARQHDLAALDFDLLRYLGSWLALGNDRLWCRYCRRWLGWRCRSRRCGRRWLCHWRSRRTPSLRTQPFGFTTARVVFQGESFAFRGGLARKWSAVIPKDIDG